MLKAKLLLPNEFIKDYTKTIVKAERCVYMMALVIDDDSVTHPVLQAACDAAGRGVDVHVAADVMTYGEVAGSYIGLRLDSARKYRHTRNVGKHLHQAGVDFRWLGRTKPFMFYGRTHIKFYIADDTVYTFGGINLYENGISNTDYLFKIVDRDLSDALISVYNNVLKSDHRDSPYKSYVAPYGDDAILLDGGRINDSIIYKRACELAAEAKSVTLVSQYPPYGKLARLINRIPHEIYFNRINQATFINRIVIQYGMMRSHDQNKYHHKNYLHAKYALFEMHDGHYVAITGSHNLVRAGATLATREIALETTNRSIVKQLQDFTAQHVAGR